MTTQPTTLIEIKTNPRNNFPRLFFGLTAQVGVIALGIAADSTAMQWSGFLFFSLTLFGFAMIELKKNDGLTIAEARARLDELESKE